MGAEQSQENEKNGLSGMVLCGREFQCGGCMDVDNSNSKYNQNSNAPLDQNGQLTQPMKKDVQQMIKNQKNNQWTNSDQTYATDSQNQLRSSYRNSAQPYPQGGMPNDNAGGQNAMHNTGEGMMAMKQGGQDGFNIFDSKEIQQNLNPGDKNRKLMLSKLVKQGQVGTLQLKVLSSAHLEKDFTLLINPMGIVPQQQQNYAEQMALQGYENGPRRGEFDGYTYFGVEDGTKADDEDSNDDKDGAGATGGYIEDATGKQVLRKEMNDFIIPTNNPNNSDASKEMPSANPMMGGGNNHQGRQFYIQFDPIDRFYKIRDLGKGYGAFAKLQGSIIIRDSFLINIGESYVVSYLISNNQDEYEDSQQNNQLQAYKLKLKIFPPYNLENPDVVICQNEKQELVIGRSPNCDIRIDDQLISKMQSTIKYEDGNWILEDGHDGKESTNGTWYYLNQEQAIQDGMIFKQNQTFFVANLV